MPLSLHSAQHLPHFLTPPGRLLSLWDLLEFDRLESLMPTFTEDNRLETRGMLESVSRSVVSDSLRPMDCSPSDSSVHGILHAGILEWVAISFSRGIFLTQGSNLGLLHGRQTLYHQSRQGSLETKEGMSY